MRFIPFLFLSLILLAACGPVNPPTPKMFRKALTDLPLDSLNLPPGYQIDVYAEGVTNARSLELTPNGTLFVGTRDEGAVYALVDRDQDMHADTVYVLAEDLNMPNGVAFRNGDLYVAEVSRILRFPDVENNLDKKGNFEVVYDQYPTDRHHGWKFISFGPDGKLYVPVGAPCNICESENPVYNTITTLDVDTKEMNILHEGIRNTVGFTWHPETGHLWFTDNGRDMLGDDSPACELNHATEPGMHFGYPYCHEGDLPDPEFGDKRDCSEFTAPAMKLGPHVAPLGVEFYTGSMFPDEMRHQILIAEHGSWNRSKKIGYRITKVTVDENGNATSYEPFIDGWLDEEDDDVWGRPVDIEHMPDGSLLISDDYADAIYRLYYEG